jgi:hypothetical protein
MDYIDAVSYCYLKKSFDISKLEEKPVRVS